MEIIYITLILILGGLGSYFIIKYQKISKSISQTNLKDENIKLIKQLEIISEKNSELTNSLSLLQIKIDKILVQKNEELRDDQIKLENLNEKFKSEINDIRVNFIDEKEIILLSLRNETSSAINQKNEEIANLKKNFETNSENFKSEIFNLKNKFLIEKEHNYDKGIAKGKELSNYEIQIHPYQSVSKNKKFLGSEDVINVGYKYMMFINGIPCLNSHIEIFETISKKEINEERVNNLISKIGDLINIVPNANMKLVGNLNDFGKNLLKFKK